MDLPWSLQPYNGALGTDALLGEFGSISLFVAFIDGGTSTSNVINGPLLIGPAEAYRHLPSLSRVSQVLGAGFMPLTRDRHYEVRRYLP
jgi:hypothetical protein